MIDALLKDLLLYGVFPLWLLAGFADYCCHRATRIEATSGTAESTLHVLQYAQIVIGVALPLFFTVTTLVLALVIAMALAHLATGYWDVAYTDGRRYISPPEQHVHSYMEVLPLVATALLVVLHWPAFVAMFDGTAASWAIHLRPQMAPAGVIAYVASGLVLAGAAIAEEYVRCIRHRRVAGSSA